MEERTLFESMFQAEMGQRIGLEADIESFTSERQRLRLALAEQQGTATALEEYRRDAATGLRVERQLGARVAAERRLRQQLQDTLADCQPPVDCGALPTEPGEPTDAVLGSYGEAVLRRGGASREEIRGLLQPV